MTDKETRKIRLGAEEFLATAFDSTDRLAILVRNRGRGETMQRITTVGRIAEPSFQQWLHFKNDREGADVYIGMNPLKPEARTRTKDDVLSIHHLYVDLDHEGPKSLASIEQSKTVPMPNYILTTSPGKFQVVWRVEGIPQDKAEALLRVMARKFGGDPAATDSTRVLRIPGFRNTKYTEAFVVRAEHHSDRVYHELDFKVRIDQLDSPYQPLRRHSASVPATEPRRISQSERDWAFAKRALASGVDPEEIVHRIAEFRAGEKHDVNDYARRTVTKAAAELQGQDGDHTGEAAVPGMDDT